MEKMDQMRADCNLAKMEHTLNDLKTYVERAARESMAAHEVETGIWRQVLQLGYQALEVFFTRVGPGDVGKSVTLPDGREVRRLATRHPHADVPERCAPCMPRCRRDARRSGERC